MAIDAGSATRVVELLDSVRELPYRHSFYSIVRTLVACHRDRPRIGYARRPADEVVRFGQEPNTAFAGAQVTGCDQGHGKRPPRVFLRGFGLFGPHGALPLHLTEYARNRELHDRDRTFRAFADMFHHRLFALFYRAWAAAEPCVQRDRPDADRFADQINALIGFNFPALHDRGVFPDEAKRYFSGHLSRQSRDPDSLVAMVSATFSVDCSIGEYSPGWITIPLPDRLKLNRQANVLGVSTAIGRRAWTAQPRFTLHLGPLDLEAYTGLFPAAAEGRQLAEIVRLYVGLDLDAEVHLVLRADQIPPPQVDGSRQLGRTFWLGGSRARSRDGDELRYLLNQLE